MSDPTSSPAAVVADTIIPTVELGVRITDAAVDGDATVVSASYSTMAAASVRAVGARVSWDTVNTMAMDATQMIVAADTGRLGAVRVVGVDEHRWSYPPRCQDGYVTVPSI